MEDLATAPDVVTPPRIREKIRNLVASPDEAHLLATSYAITFHYRVSPVMAAIEISIAQDGPGTWSVEPFTHVNINSRNVLAVLEAFGRAKAFLDALKAEFGDAIKIGRE